MERRPALGRADLNSPPKARDRLAEEESEGDISLPDFKPEDWEPDDHGGGFGDEDGEIDAIFEHLG